MKKAYTMKTVAAVLAALTIMSPISLVSAAEMDIISSAEGIEAEDCAEMPAETYEDTPSEYDIPDSIHDYPQEIPAEAIGMDTNTPPVSGAEAEDCAESDGETALIRIIFDLDGGALDGKEAFIIAQEAGTEIYFDAVPVREGYTFIKWDRAIPAVMPEEDMTIKAVWEDDFRLFCRDAVAEVNNETAFGPYTAALTDCDQEYFASDNSTEKEVFDKIMDLDNALIDDLADLLPMGKTLTQPLKWLTSWMSGEVHKDDVDPVQELINKRSDETNRKIDKGFSEVNTRIDQLDSRISTLSSDLNNATARITSQMDNMQRSSETRDEWIRIMNENSSRLTQCTANLNDLNAKATGISGMYYQIAGIESDDTINEYQKLIDIAALSHDPTMKAMTEKLDILADNMYGKTGTLNTNFFEAVAVSDYGNVMFTREAWKNSRATCDVIVEQYITAALLYLRTLEAEKAIASFGEDELYQTDADYVAQWKQICKKKNTIDSRYDRIKLDLEKVITGYKNYVEKIGTVENRFVDHCRRNNTVKLAIRHIDVYGYDDVNLRSNPISAKKMQSIYDEAYSGDVLSISDMKRLIEYMREHERVVSEGTPYERTVYSTIPQWLEYFSGEECGLTENDYRNAVAVTGNVVETEGSWHKNYSVDAVSATNRCLRTEKHVITDDELYRMGDTLLVIELH